MTDMMFAAIGVAADCFCLADWGPTGNEMESPCRLQILSCNIDWQPIRFIRFSISCNVSCQRLKTERQVARKTSASAQEPEHTDKTFLGFVEACCSITSAGRLLAYSAMCDFSRAPPCRCFHMTQGAPAATSARTTIRGAPNLLTRLRICWDRGCLRPQGISIQLSLHAFLWRKQQRLQQRFHIRGCAYQAANQTLYQLPFILSCHCCVAIQKEGN